MNTLNILGTIVLGAIGIVAVAWIIAWKIYAVWTAAHNGHKKWFVALLFLNTISILEMYYIFKVVGRSKEEAKEDFCSGWNEIKNFKISKKSEPEVQEN